MSGELISVIIPIYKVEQWLKRCVDSVCHQTYDNLEIILVDDGSPDNCGKLCDAFATHDSRIRVCHKENGGLSDARNAGVKIASGKLITFIDSDDYVAPNYVEYLYNLLKRTKADIACCGYMETEGDDCSFVQTDTYQIFSAHEACLRKGLPELIVSWGKLFPVELIRRYPFPKGKINEDEFTTYRYFYDSSAIAMGEAKLYAYFQNPNGIMSKAIEAKQTDAYEAMVERAKFFEEKNEKQLASAAWRRYRDKLIRDNKKHQNWSLEEYKALLQQHLFHRYFTLREKLYDICYIYFPWVRNIGKRIYSILHRS